MLSNGGNAAKMSSAVKKATKMKIKSIKKPTVKKIVTKKCARRCTKKQTNKVAKQNVTFTVHADRGKSVYVAGSFNQWSTTAKKMAYKARAGIYTATVKLAPGTYEYKFILDGTWCADPENANAVANDQGTFNSVIVVK